MRLGKASETERLREGTELLDARGSFRLVDDRVVFLRTEGDSRYIGLENLNLERIVSEISNNPTQLEWSVVGTITEYRGSNYLMVRRAILSKRTVEPVASTSPAPAGGQPATVDPLDASPAPAAKK
ncbi:MAG: hypothetical protein ACYC6Y_12320 [Thermoguttaceae bacterium]